jgi:hypothetical protein
MTDIRSREVFQNRRFILWEVLKMEPSDICKASSETGFSNLAQHGLDHLGFRSTQI